ncbi:MAG: prephenate/arogenate dehydrogenase family protein [Pseudomonadota bacterium]
MIFRHVALIGLGLIGSSIAHACKVTGAAGRVTGYARSAETRATAARIGFCEVFETAAEAVDGADCVVLCVPVGVCGAVMAEIGDHIADGALISDVGSVKQDLIAAMAPHVPTHAHFVPGHPMAGTEHSGPEAGFAALFQNRWVILTPLPGGSSEKSDQLARFWQALGAKTTLMTPEHHDLVVAVTSHVPHAIAYTMVGVADDMRRITDREVVEFSAAGFRDFTRIAASDPTMWRDVFLNNKEATLDVLGRFTEELMTVQSAIRRGDGDYLHDYFTRTRAIRRGIIEAGQDTEAPDFGRITASETKA